MATYKAFMLLLGLILLGIRVYYGALYTVDTAVIVLYFLLCLPIAAEYLAKAKIFGAEFEFKDKIVEAKEFVEKSKTASRKKHIKAKGIESGSVVSTGAVVIAEGEKNESTLSVFELQLTKEILRKDANLALASLRIEIERKIRDAYYLAFPASTKVAPLRSMMSRLKDKGWLEQEQIEALKLIIGMCNKAVHGAKIERSTAKEIIELAEDLNKTFSMGYYLNLDRNHNYKDQGLICEWEHCIELMPLPPDRNSKSCPVFGHECPGGSGQVLKCDKGIEDIPKERFIKG